MDVNALVFDSAGNLYTGGGCYERRGHKRKLYCQMGRRRRGLPLGSGMDSSVRALAINSSGNLYAGGYFKTAGDETVNDIAKWDGEAWSALGTGMNDFVDALAIDASGNLYAGGYFTTAGGVSANHIAKWDGESWSALGSGMKRVL